MNRLNGTVTRKTLIVGIAFIAALVAILTATMPEAHNPYDDRTQPDPHIAPGR